MKYAPFYANYISLSKDINLLEGLNTQGKEVVDFFLSIPKEKLLFRYEIEKWTPKDILLHLIDAERIFAYRTLRISRNDKTPLPGFEEDDYVKFAQANNRTLESLIEEYKSVRKSTFTLFESFSNEDFAKSGTASEHEVSVDALGYIIIGHEKHHLNIIKEKYL